MEDDEINIDDLINDVASQMEASKENTEIATSTTTVPAIIEEHTDDTLIALTLKKNDEVEVMADKAFQMFFKELERGTDHTSSSKEQMIAALQVRVELNKTMVELAKLKKKQENKMGILINTVSPVQAGINLSNIKDSLDDF